jgi:hypothetical protein
MGGFQPAGVFWDSIYGGGYDRRCILGGILGGDIIYTPSYRRMNLGDTICGCVSRGLFERSVLDGSGCDCTSRTGAHSEKIPRY